MKLHFKSSYRRFLDQPFAACSYWIKGPLTINPTKVTCESCKKTAEFKESQDVR